MDPLVRNVWVLMQPASNVPGEWLAHCLDFDVMSQGNSPSHALEMIFEAINITVEEDLRARRDPFARRAPDEEWKTLWSIVNSGRRTPVEELLKNATAETTIALQVMLCLFVA